MANNTFTIGIDFGGVLSIHDGGDQEHQNTSLNMPNALESLEELSKSGHRLLLISFCGYNRAVDTKKCISDAQADKFFTDIYFVKMREDKKYICEKQGCHFMIDDRPNVLKFVAMHNKNIIPILFGAQKHPHYKCAETWKDVMKIISETNFFDVKPNEKLNVNQYIHKV